jgi:hypothetical protein
LCITPEIKPFSFRNCVPITMSDDDRDIDVESDVSSAVFIHKTPHGSILTLIHYVPPYFRKVMTPIPANRPPADSLLEASIIHR